ncbi:MAG: hypothetical protein B7Y41_11470 [Hydrogenophilales bacterium 28-61-23]|nr:MAG: hypothetical protein B7Y41_11470 [Hydrogenophilales bacterium 28-61-23]
MTIGAIGASAGFNSTQLSRPAQAAGREALSPAQQQQVQKLKQIDQKVRAHEAAHMAAGAGLTGGANLEYVRGPDGRQYAVAGEVSIDTSAAQTPEQTIEKAKRIQAAALAPADPSSQDRSVAAQAAQMATQAQAELNRTRRDGDAESNAGPAANAATSRDRRAVAAYSNLEPQPESILSLFA